MPSARPPRLSSITASQGHIDAIADRYICPGETMDYAWARRVFPVSPNSFYTYLQVIYFGLRGLEVEQNARRILESLTRLKDDSDRFAEDYRLVGSYFRRVQLKHDEGLPKLESIQQSLLGHLATASSVEALEAGDTAELSI